MTVTIPGRPQVILHCLLSIETGGLEVMVLNLAAATDRSLFQPRVICLQTIGALAPRFEAAGIPVELIDDPASGGRRTLASLTRYLKRLKPDLIHTHNRGAHQHGAFARKAVGIRTHLHTRHDRTYPSSWKPKLLERAATRLTDRIVAVSRDAMEVARLHDGARPEQLVTIPNGVDLEAFSLRTPHYGWRVVHVARLDPVKDQETLIHAAALVSANHPQFHLDLIGDGPSRPHLEQLTDSLGLRNTVTFHGMQSDVRPWLSTADLFVLSSRSEGLAMTLLEAMGSGLPVIATDVGGNSEAVVDGVTGRLIPPADPAELAQAIVMMLENPDVAWKMGMAGRERVTESFSLRNMVDRYQQLYQELLSSPGGTEGTEEK